jgi:hypothetical protein
MMGMRNVLLKNITTPVRCMLPGRLTQDSLMKLYEKKEKRACRKNPQTLLGIGTPGRNRTCDTRIRNPVLYPLSYEGLLCSNLAE